MREAMECSRDDNKIVENLEKRLEDGTYSNSPWEDSIGIMLMLLKKVSSLEEIVDRLTTGKNKEFLTVQEAAELTGYSVGTLYNMKFKKRLKFYSPNNKNLFIKYTDLMEFLSRNSNITMEEIVEKDKQTDQDHLRKYLPK